MTRSSRTTLMLITLIITFVSTLVLADERPIQLALLTPVQLFPETDTVCGVRLNLLYGRNVSVTGLDIGLINHTTQGISTGSLDLLSGQILTLWGSRTTM